MEDKGSCYGSHGRWTGKRERRGERETQIREVETSDHKENTERKDGDGGREEQEAD